MTFFSCFSSVYLFLPFFSSFSFYPFPSFSAPRSIPLEQVAWCDRPCHARHCTCDVAAAPSCCITALAKFHPTTSHVRTHTFLFWALCWCHASLLHVNTPVSLWLPARMFQRDSTCTRVGDSRFFFYASLVFFYSNTGRCLRVCFVFPLQLVSLELYAKAPQQTLASYHASLQRTILDCERTKLWHCIFHHPRTL